ncbi:hypothetical protein [Rossellomorea aquimaris]|uniref:hypothetical protein n=1 Tax=Rossellomorea aquimaris TaxID=189382 RepID=UPI0024957AAC|nr:hypothetical protein [Rossellomorea aquimaris]
MRFLFILLGFILGGIFAFIGPEIATCALLGAILFLLIYDGIDLNHLMQKVKDSQMK